MQTVILGVVIAFTINALAAAKTKHAEFWTPIAIGTGTNPLITLCVLDYSIYSLNPSLTPMFKDLVKRSGCSGDNKRVERMDVLLAEMDKDEAEASSSASASASASAVSLAPSGFVFHESRVGSTLVANLLGSDPHSLVFSESTPPVTALMHCTACTRQQTITLFQQVMRLMGRTSYHTRLYFKFQSVSATKMAWILEAFPLVPWVFVFRSPVQAMMSHLDPLKVGSSGGRAVCLRYKRKPFPEAVQALQKAVGVDETIASGKGKGKAKGVTPNYLRSMLATDIGTKNVPNEAHCAAHLFALCARALAAFDSSPPSPSPSSSPSSSNASQGRGLFLNYESLPGSVATVVLPHFHSHLSCEWARGMQASAELYSKSRQAGRADGKSGVFKPDSKDKDRRATEPIRKWAAAILDPSFDRLDQLSATSVAGIASKTSTDSGGSNSVRNSLRSNIKGGSNGRKDGDSNAVLLQQQLAAATPLSPTSTRKGRSAVWRAMSPMGAAIATAC